MKGGFLIALLIGLLIVGVLVMRNTKEHQSKTTPDKMEAVKQAEQTVADSQKRLDAMQRKIQPDDE